MLLLGCFVSFPMFTRRTFLTGVCVYVVGDVSSFRSQMDEECYVCDGVCSIIIIEDGCNRSYCIGFNVFSILVFAASFIVHGIRLMQFHISKVRPSITYLIISANSSMDIEKNSLFDGDSSLLFKDRQVGSYSKY